MKPLSPGDAAQIAALAQLEVPDDELEGLRSDMSAILEHMDALAQVSTEGVEPLTHAVPTDLRLRPDEPGESLAAARVVEAAPDHQDGQFRVPAIIDGGGQ